MIKSIIFDLDGVLVETKDIHFQALNLAIKKICKIDEAINREKKIAQSGTDGGSRGGSTTVVNNTNVNNQANTATNSMAFPKSAKNKDNNYNPFLRYQGA